jgi:hypothetical protein
VFFSYTQFGQRTTYRLSAIATVKEKIQQNAIYSDAKKQIFRRYLNLLIAPANEAMTKFKWNEPCYPGGQHKNWLWRVVNRSVFTHQDLDGWCPSEIGLGQLVRAKLFCFGNNYVVFATGETETYILANPPKVAVSIDNDVENWCEDSVSQGVFLRTLELARGYAENGRGLRIRGVRQPHCPAVRWRMDDDDALKNWRAEFIAFLKHYGFESRGLKVGR